jgi:flavin-dependent dehydrogenase
MTRDVVVIGAGPAGSVAARELARRARSVLLVDKAHFPRSKVCGCCLNTGAVRTLQRLGLGHVLANGVPLRAVNLAAGRRSAQVTLPGGLALSREAFDAALVTEAVKAGAEFRAGVTAKVAECGRDAREVLVNGEIVHAQVVVVASGLAGNETAPEAGSRIGAGASVPTDTVPPFFAPGTIFMATARGGYVGLVRVEDGRLDVAAAFDVGFLKSHGGPGPAAEAVLDEVGWPRVPDLAEMPWKGTPALTRRATALAGARWFAVGDAAGYVEPFTGEGMAWALVSAAALAPIAARAAQKWDDALPGEWEHTYRRALGRRQRTCRVVSRVLRSPVLTALAVGALSVCPPLARPLVSALNRQALFSGAPA